MLVTSNEISALYIPGGVGAFELRDGDRNYTNWKHFDALGSWRVELTELSAFVERN